MSPGAVPSCWGIGVAPAGTSAWRPLLSGMSRPRELNISAMRLTISVSRTSGTAMTSAMASRVMSSWVGPSPPHTTTPSLRASAVRNASTMRAWLSPTTWWKWESIPARASCSPIHAELVSTIWPRSSSVPTARISTLIGAVLERAHRRRSCAARRPSRRYCTPVTTVKATATQIGHVEDTLVRRHRRGQAQQDGDALDEGLRLGARRAPGWRCRGGPRRCGRRSSTPRAPR